MKLGKYVIGVCCAVVFGGVAMNAPAAAAALNGTWQLDAAASDDLDQAAEALADRLNAQARKSRDERFDRSRTRNTGNRYDRQVEAVESMIREDNRSLDWGGPPAVREMLGVETLKLYQSRKVVILYGGVRKRLLTINPAGRAYSVSGQELNHDELGRSLAFVDDGDLVVETELNSGGQLVERFSTDAAGERLVVSIQQRSLRKGPWLEFERVFQRIE